MIILIIFTLIFSLILSTIIISSPLGLLFWILLIRRLRVSLLNFHCLRFFCYLLIIIYVGSLLVIFSYFVRIDRNQKLDLKFSLIISFSLIPFIFLNIFWIIKKNTLVGFIFSLYNFENIIFLLLIGFCLLISLLGVVKIRTLFEGRLRRFFFI